MFSQFQYMTELLKHKQQQKESAERAAQQLREAQGKA